MRGARGLCPARRPSNSHLYLYLSALADAGSRRPRSAARSPPPPIATSAPRRSELVALDVADLAWSKPGLRVTIRRSKTDQEGAAQSLPCPKSGTCPPRPSARLLDIAGITLGPVFGPLWKRGKRCATPGCSTTLRASRSRRPFGAKRSALMPNCSWLSLGLLRWQAADERAPGKTGDYNWSPCTAACSTAEHP